MHHTAAVTLITAAAEHLGLARLRLGERSAILVYAALVGHVLKQPRTADHTGLVVDAGERTWAGEWFGSARTARDGTREDGRPPVAYCQVPFVYGLSEFSPA
jgi:hypothetical protein